MPRDPSREETAVQQRAALHVTSVGAYTAVFAVLLLLTALTTWVSSLDLGSWNVIVALGIATVKAVLVALYFMHARHSTRLTKVVMLGGLLWLALLLLGTASDYLTRDWLNMFKP